MAHESFEDPQTAEILNRDFVPVKVDREERPDVDAVYMSAVLAMTGSGGWPLSVFLTPTGEPFFGGTYFPPVRRWGLPSFREVLTAVARAWQQQRQHLVEQAAALVTALRAQSERPLAGHLDLRAAEAAFLARLQATFDPTWGGFGPPPKFPTPSRLFLLCDLARDSKLAQHLLGVTLDGMAAGGMYDWLGGGFHRYSVDERWLVPHFEKMLYDNALLARLYGHAGLQQGNSRWLGVARQTAGWLCQEMQGPEGGFFSSLDADSLEGEGAYFTWTAEEVQAALPPARARLVMALCEFASPSSVATDRRVLRPLVPLAEAAAEAGIAIEEATHELELARRELLAARQRRPAPACDDKQLAGWNGMAVWALAWLGAALPEPRYLAAAHRAASFLRQRVDSRGGIQRAWCRGTSSGAETLEDIAWVAAGWLQLGEVTGEPFWLDAAAELVQRRAPHYLAAGVLYDTPDDGPALIVRPRTVSDNATPAPSAVLAWVAAQLAALTSDTGMRELGERIVTAGAEAVARAPEAVAFLLLAARTIHAPRTIVVSGEPACPETKSLLATALSRTGFETAVLRAPATPSPELVARFPLLAGRRGAVANSPLAWVCEKGTCHPPASTADALAALLVGA